MRSAWATATVAFSLVFGHWAYGASDVIINGNAAIRLDPHPKNVALTDLARGSAVFPTGSRRSYGALPAHPRLPGCQPSRPRFDW